jgi:hypothetical protein
MKRIFALAVVWPRSALWPWLGRRSASEFRSPTCQGEMTRACVFCGASLEGRRAHARFCGAPCRREHCRLSRLLRGQGDPPERVSFDASSSSDPDGRIVRYQWDLDGDGSFETDTGSTPAASRSYRRPQTVEVGLRVTDDAGGSATTSVALQVGSARGK